MEEGLKSTRFRLLRRFFRNKLAALSLLVFIVVLLFCLIGPYFTSYDPVSLDLENARSDPSLIHPMGTDSLGRDVMTRMMYGGRVTLGITFTAVVVSLLGIPLGIIAGFVGGKTDSVISQVNDALASIPTFLMVLVAESVFGWGDGNYKYALGVALIPPLLRVTRAAVLNVKSHEYIEAARALGVSNIRIICGHVLRNISAPLIIHITGSLADTIIMCTLMGYLGVGVDPPTPEWGSIVRNGFDSILSRPIHMIIPCAVIVLCVLSLNLIGNGLRDAMGEGRETT